MRTTYEIERRLVRRYIARALGVIRYDPAECGDDDEWREETEALVARGWPGVMTMEDVERLVRIVAEDAWSAGFERGGQPEAWYDLNPFSLPSIYEKYREARIAWRRRRRARR